MESAMFGTFWSLVPPVTAIVLALIVCARVMDMLNRPRTDITAVEDARLAEPEKPDIFHYYLDKLKKMFA